MMTQQFKILTGHMAICRDGEQHPIVNPFYGKTEDYVRDNIHAAEECYRDIYIHFRNLFLLLNGYLPPEEWETFEM